MLLSSSKKHEMVHDYDFKKVSDSNADISVCGFKSDILIGFGFECEYIGVRIRIGNGADSDRKQK
jgi:hypothetical protein